MNRGPITAERFPTPALALRTDDPARQAPARAFAHRQARAAEAARERLAGLWAAGTASPARVDALRTVHRELVDWRYRYAVRHGGPPGRQVPYLPERFRTPITAANPNYDMFGPVERLREGSVWDPDAELFRGGLDTPAYRVMLRYGRYAERRFARQAPGEDVLQNVVRLPDGRRVHGNRLLRGAAATRLYRELAARAEERGTDVRHLKAVGHPLYTVTADPADNDTIFEAALRLLAAPDLDGEGLLAAGYLLYQSPRTKKGSDAVTRTFLVTVGSLLLGDRAPRLPDDIDLRCYVLDQDTATRPAGHGAGRQADGPPLVGGVE
ncbi:hypothetical protein ABTX81_19925 [Kitasatospora sp. NPDC097605]|uniref:hypothetical protein n=1 Tax=Kitasatospora sp. NPDC097605 TaxID=3157226 RepID=UPI00332A8494